MLNAVRSTEGDEISPVNVLLPVCTHLMFEASVYSNMKAKAQLFYKLKYSE